MINVVVVASFLHLPVSLLTPKGIEYRYSFFHTKGKREADLRSTSNAINWISNDEFSYRVSCIGLKVNYEDIFNPIV